MNNLKPLSLLFPLLLTACAGHPVLNALSPATGYNLAANIAYDERTGQRLDIYTPNDAKNAPAIVFFYDGDRWQTGSKNDYEFVGEALSSKGFVVVIADYRKYPQVRYPAFVEDGAHAVAWTHRNIAQYGGDPNKLFVMGHGAGAYIAAMLALDPEFLQGVGGGREWLSGMIGLAGPYDFLPLTDPDLRDLFGPPEKFQQTQPVMYADGQNPPLLLLHSENDEIVTIKNTRNLAARVKNAGGPVETVIYPKLSHSRMIEVLAATLRRWADVREQIADFVNSHARGAGAAP